MSSTVTDIAHRFDPQLGTCPPRCTPQPDLGETFRHPLIARSARLRLGLSDWTLQRDGQQRGGEPRNIK
jgi:hypothetical protein